MNAFATPGFQSQETIFLQSSKEIQEHWQHLLKAENSLKLHKFCCRGGSRWLNESYTQPSACPCDGDSSATHEAAPQLSQISARQQTVQTRASLFNFTDWKLQQIRKFFCESFSCPHHQDMTATLLRATQQPAEGPCYCFTIVPHATQKACGPAPVGCPQSVPLDTPYCWSCWIQEGLCRPLELLQDAMGDAYWKVKWFTARTATPRQNSVHTFQSLVWEWNNSSAPWTVCRMVRSMQMQCPLNVMDWDQ